MKRKVEIEPLPPLYLMGYKDGYQKGYRAGKKYQHIKQHKDFMWVKRR